MHFKVNVAICLNYTFRQEIEAASVNAQVKQLREELAASEERFRDTLQVHEINFVVLTVQTYL